MSYEVHKKRFQDDLKKQAGFPPRNASNSHRAFIEDLKKQVLPTPSRFNVENDESDDDGILDEESLKVLEKKFNELFADLNDDD